MTIHPAREPASRPVAGGASYILLHNTTEVVTPDLAGEKIVRFPKGAVVFQEGRVVEIGPAADLASRHREARPVNANGHLVTPGLVDCHTHMVFAGHRAEEFHRRLKGESYEDIAAAGGGILATVRATRAAGPERLAAATVLHRGWMRRQGTTTWEGKSGYGLDRDTELAQLRAVRDAGGVPTWLGAHAVPPEHRDADAYVDWAIQAVLPDAARIATAADVFVERGTFDVEQARRYLQACRRAGLDLRLHGDQLNEIGAVGLAVELGARSIDHLEATGSKGVAALAASDVVGVLLPVAALYLNRPMPPGRALVDAGAAIALASDFNPGSAYCESLPVVCTLACTQLGLAPEEALAACTVNAAHVLGLSDRGRVAPGYRADLVLLDARDWRHLAYHLAGDLVRTVIRRGRVAFARA